MYDDDHMKRMRMKQKNISQIESMGITSWLDEKKKNRARSKASLYWEGCDFNSNKRGGHIKQ